MAGADQAICGAILLGGQARRLGGVAKGLIEVDGEPIVARLLRALDGVGVAEVLLVGGPAEAYARFGRRHVADRWPGWGPLGGLATALAAAPHDPLLLLAGDLPHVDAAALAVLLAAPAEAEAVLPRHAAGTEPLCARYRRSCLVPAERLLAAGERSLQRLLEQVGTVYLAAGDFPAGERTWFNLNRLDDVAAAGGRLPPGGEGEHSS